MINFDGFTEENKEEHNQNWPQIPVHQYTMLIIGRSESGKETRYLT